LRGADGHYLGDYVVDPWDWWEGDEFTDPEGRRFRIVTIDAALTPGAIHATWTVEPV
jgi:hypothetical protein